MQSTVVVALSAAQVRQFRSSESYVIVQITDPGTKRPYIYPRSALKGKIGFHFDDILPDDAVDPDGFQRYVPMSVDQAQSIARFVHAHVGKVATIIVHCHAGLSRSTGIAAAICEHFGLSTDEFYVRPKNPNAHCKALMRNALVETAG